MSEMQGSAGFSACGPGVEPAGVTRGCIVIRQGESEEAIAMTAAMLVDDDGVRTFVPTGRATLVRIVDDERA